MCTQLTLGMKEENDPAIFLRSDQNNRSDQCDQDRRPVPVDPAGDCCYRSSSKTCKSEDSARSPGELLSSTSIICP